MAREVVVSQMRPAVPTKCANRSFSDKVLRQWGRGMS